jgi:hypothetical protein
MLARARAFASTHPALFSGAWFAALALLMACPLGAMTLLLLALEVAEARPAGAYILLILASAVLPPVLAFATGALGGPRILRLPPGKPFQAAGWGAAAALGALALWALLLELLPRLPAGGEGAATGGGDVPGAAVAVGYLVVLPLIVVVCLVLGAVAGVLLHAFAGRTEAAAGLPVLEHGDSLRLYARDKKQDAP